MFVIVLTDGPRERNLPGSGSSFRGTILAVSAAALDSP